MLIEPVHPLQPPTVHVISDVVCPWCYVGKRRLEIAFGQLSEPPSVVVQWLPFQLNPAMPAEGVDRNAYRQAKFGSIEKSTELDARLVSVGKEVGIEFRFDLIERTPNTFDAHRLVWAAAKQGSQNALVERLFRAYFVEGRDVGGSEVLIEIAETEGIEGAAKLFESEESVDRVKQELDIARGLQVQGVPFFVFGRRLSVSGAQTPEVLLAAFQEAAASDGN
ncbi:MAG: DsbA family oxidoreductase [bacterium]|nr:DsbA family oxidoreductase [bacterium]